MTPRADDFEKDNHSATDDDDDDDDDGLKDDMAALARACMIVVPPPDHNSTAEDDIPDAEDPLLHAGDAIVPPATDSDDDRDDLECLKRVQSLYQPLSVLPPLTPLAAGSDDDDVDDLETARAIMKRFGTSGEGGTETFVEGDSTSSPGYEGNIGNSLIHYESDAGELCPVSQDPSEAATEQLIDDIQMQLSNFVESPEPVACELRLPQKRLSCPPVVQCFVDAIKKNRDLQRFIRSKLIELETKIEENKKIRNKIKILKDFQASCIRRTGNALSLKKDPRVQLISAKKSLAPNNSKKHKKVSAMCYGPEENSHVANYRMVLERFPLSLDRKKWSNAERGSLFKGIKQQFQEMVLQLSLSVDRTSSEGLLGDANDMDNVIASVKDLEITPERIRQFLPRVNWDLIASMYVGGRSGAECESRWLNCEDPLINQGAWTNEEDKSLLRIVQDMGIRNWFDIAASLGTSRTPFQCLARFQRSLNPCMLNSEWTEEEDSQLCSAVACFGDRDWQSVASVLERRTGTQCSNRWKKSLCPEKKGSFTQEEDIRLTVAVMLFGRKWNQIAKYVPGRIQSQCRDRYLNSLDPSLKWGGWTEEEDLRLEAAIVKHGYCWSKIAEEVPPRTDSQCRKRWKVLCPEQVPLLQEARKKQRSIIGSNFVDRESERPTITLNDFLPLPTIAAKSDFGASNLRKKGKSSNVLKKVSKKRAKRTRLCTQEVRDTEVCNDDGIKTCGEVISPCMDVPKKTSKKRAKRTQLSTKEVQDMAVYKDDGVKTCGEVISPCSDVPKKTSKKRAKRTQLCTKEVQDMAVYKDDGSKTCGEVISPCSDVPKKTSKKRAKRTQLCTKEVQDMAVYKDDGSKTCGEVISPCSDVPKKMRSERQTENTQNCPKEVVDISCSDKVNTCIESSERQSTCIASSENQDSDNINIECYLRDKSKEMLSRFTNDLSQASSCRITDVSKQVESQDPCSSTVIPDDSGLSMSRHVEEKDDEPSSFQNRPRRQPKRPSRFL